MKELGELFINVPGPSYKWEDPEIVRKERETADNHNKGIRYYKSLHKPFIIMQRLYKYRHILTFASLFFFVLNMTGGLVLMAHGHPSLVLMWIPFLVSWFLTSDAPKKIYDYFFWKKIGRHVYVKHLD